MVGEDDGTDPVHYEFEHAIIATGSRLVEIPGFKFDGDSVLSSRGALKLDAIPESVVVVGAGYIGMELSMVLAKLRVNVTVIEMLDEILPGYESDLTRPVRERAEELDIDYSFGESAADWTETSNGIVVKTKTVDGSESTYEVTKTIVAVGRTPVTDTLNLSAIGLEPDDRGFLETDNTARIDLDHVFAIGDVAGEPMLAHTASADSTVAVEIIDGQPACLDSRTIPAAVFIHPEIATVGMTESMAEEADFDPVVGKFPLRLERSSTDYGPFWGIRPSRGGRRHRIRSRGADSRSRGLGTGRRTRPRDRDGATLEDVATTIHTHPTLSEGVREATEHALGHAIHTLDR